MITNFFINKFGEKGRACASPKRSDVFCERQFFPSSNSTQDSYSTRNVTTLLKKSGFYDRQGKEARPAQ